MKLSRIINLVKGGQSTVLSHLKNIFEMAMIDRHFNEREYHLLMELAEKYEVSESELSQILGHPEMIEFDIPKDRKIKFKQLYELIRMMVSDGRILKKEEKLCRYFAKQYGFTNRKKLVRVLSENVVNGQPWKEALARTKLTLMF